MKKKMYDLTIKPLGTLEELAEELPIDAVIIGEVSGHITAVFSVESNGNILYDVTGKYFGHCSDVLGDPDYFVSLENTEG